VSPPLCLCRLTEDDRVGARDADGQGPLAHGLERVLDLEPGRGGRERSGGVGSRRRRCAPRRARASLDLLSPPHHPHPLLCSQMAVRREDGDRAVVLGHGGWRRAGPIPLSRPAARGAGRGSPRGVVRPACGRAEVCGRRGAGAAHALPLPPRPPPPSAAPPGRRHTRRPRSPLRPLLSLRCGSFGARARPRARRGTGAGPSPRARSWGEKEEGREEARAVSGPRRGDGRGPGRAARRAPRALPGPAHTPRLHLCSPQSPAGPPQVPGAPPENSTHVYFKDAILPASDDDDDDEDEGGDGVADGGGGGDTGAAPSARRGARRARARVDRQKLIIILVGLPGRGKTFLCNKLMCYLNWCGGGGGEGVAGWRADGRGARVAPITPRATAPQAGPRDAPHQRGPVPPPPERGG